MKLPSLSETDLIELYHLQSFPQTRILSQAGSFDFQSSGLALRSYDTSIEIAIQFEPANYSACFLPLLRENSSIYWDKRSKVSYSDRLDFEYWQQSSFLGVLNGIVYSNFVKWVDKYIVEHPYYIPHSVCSSPDATICFIASQTSETFVIDSLAKLADLTVEMHSVLPLRTTEIRILSEREPKTVTSTAFQQSKEKIVRLQQTDDATLYANNNNTNGTFSWLFKEENTTVSVSSSALAQYYLNLVNCMSEFELEPYHSALRSCVTEKAVFIHSPASVNVVNAVDLYFLVVPRYPFVFNHHYIVDLPHARVSDDANNVGDSAIGLLLLVFVLLGFIFSVWRMKLFDWCGSKARVIKRRAIEGVTLMKERIQENAKKVGVTRRSKVEAPSSSFSSSSFSSTWGQSLFSRHHWRGGLDSPSSMIADDDSEGASLLHTSSQDTTVTEVKPRNGGSLVSRRDVELTRLDTTGKSAVGDKVTGVRSMIDSYDEFESELSPAGVRASAFRNEAISGGSAAFVYPEVSAEAAAVTSSAIPHVSSTSQRFSTVINFA